MAKYGPKPLPMEQKLLQRRHVTEAGCWEWTGPLMSVGYGSVSVRKGVRTGAHRAAFEQWRGPIPAGLCVCHTCDNRKCFNPDHLWLGTKKQNTADMVAKGRHYAHFRNRTHCKRGHPFSGRNSQGAQICHTCINAWNAENRRVKRERASDDAKLRCN